MATARHARTSAPPHIVRDPRICGGEPTVGGTRIPVRAIVVSNRFFQDQRRVQQAYPRLNPAAIDVALAYYAEHREEIDRLIEENEQAILAAD